MKLLYVKSASPMVPVHTREGRILSYQREPKTLGWEVDATELDALRPGTVLVVREPPQEPGASGPWRLEFEVLEQGS